MDNCPDEVNMNGTEYVRKDRIVPMPGPSDQGAYAGYVGKNVFVRTVTCYYTGKLRTVTAHELVLDDAAWIPSTGRFSEALKTGNLDEVEPYPGQVIVNRDAVADVSLWMTDLPRKMK